MITRVRTYCYDRIFENWIATIVANVVKKHKSSKKKRDENENTNNNFISYNDNKITKEN